MKRRVLILASALSLVLCIETVLHWVRSRGIGDWVERRQCVGVNGNSAICHAQWFQVLDGQFRFVNVEQTLHQGKWKTSGRKPDVSAHWLFYPGTMYFPPLPKTSPMNRLGFGHWTDAYSQTSSSIRLTIWAVPLWVPILGFAAFPMWAITNAMRRRWRVRTGLCAQCGYDLKGNTSGVCPECGTAIPQKVTA